jgi:phosphoribosylformylglycinamidine synthase
MAKVRALVLTGNGINCERETAHACQLAGVDTADIVPLWDLVAGDVSLDDAQLLCLPGGFLDGDDLGSARACANRLRHVWVARTKERLWTAMQRFVQKDKLVIGICNGFQLLVKLGLLPRLGVEVPTQQVSLTTNASGRFENRWVRLMAEPKSPCVFTRGINQVTFPVRHGEGRMVLSNKMQTRVDQKHLVPIHYVDAQGEPTEEYPANPNGSPGGIAGLCDETGRIFGLMPHPEAFLHRTHHPRWTRLPNLPEEGAGVALFRNAVRYLN